MKSRSNSRASPVSSETIDEIVTLEIERCKLLYESGVLDDDEINTRSDQLRREIVQLIQADSLRGQWETAQKMKMKMKTTQPIIT